MKIKTSTALRAWRRLINLLYVILAMQYANGTCSLGYAITMLVAFAGLWWMGKVIIIVTSKNGKFELYKII